jgi:hypothetical protein
MDELKLLLAVVAINAGVLAVAFLVSYALNKAVRGSGR